MKEPKIEALSLTAVGQLPVVYYFYFAWLKVPLSIHVTFRDAEENLIKTSLELEGAFPIEQWGSLNWTEERSLRNYTLEGTAGFNSFSYSQTAFSTLSTLALSGRPSLFASGWEGFFRCPCQSTFPASIALILFLPEPPLSGGGSSIGLGGGTTKIPIPSAKFGVQYETLLGSSVFGFENLLGPRVALSGAYAVRPGRWIIADLTFVFLTATPRFCPCPTMNGRLAFPISGHSKSRRFVWVWSTG